jgi:hypothetical protein
MSALRKNDKNLTFKPKIDGNSAAIVHTMSP